jgi:hypothetical protein
MRQQVDLGISIEGAVKRTLAAWTIAALVNWLVRVCPPLTGHFPGRQDRRD